jgi:Uma2 family endonuclease
MSVASKLMTTEELLALPDDGVDRELIRGELRERTMTTRGEPHCLALYNLSYLIGHWLRAQPRPRGAAYSGDIRFRLRRNPDTFVGIDLAYISPEHKARKPKDATFIDGPPVLAVEILSPHDTAEDIAEKVREYQAAGVPLVWVVDPYFRTVTVHRPDARPEMFNEDQELTAEPHLPGFRTPVAEIFAD